MKIIVSTLLLFAFLVPTVAEAATYVVNIHDDNASDFSYASADPDENDSSINCVVGGGTGNICSLRAAIDIANAAVEDTTIELPSGTITLTQENSSGAETNNESGSLDVSTSRAVTIIGEGVNETIVDSNGGSLSDRGFYMAASTDVTLEGFTLQNGSATAGAGIYSPSSVTLDSMKLKDNTASSLGGAVYIYGSVGGDLTVTDTTFDSNTASNRGGAIYFSSSLDILTVSDSLFTGNTASTEGGAIFIFNADSSDHSVTNSTFYNNESASGGAIGVGVSSGNTYTIELAIKHSTFNQNTASASGGALFIRDNGDDTAIINVYHSLLDNNTENGIADTNCAVNATNGSITSLGYNIDSGTSCSFVSTGDESSEDIELSALADNGGETFTMAIPRDSAAHNAIDSGTCENVLGSFATDQRGLSRPEGSSCDTGAYEIDETAPTVYVPVGDDSIQCSIATWTDAGAQVIDNFHDSLSYTTSGTVDESTLGTYVITYTSEADYDGNTRTGTRSVSVIDTLVPTITMLGDSTVTLNFGETYTDDGATATDACDGTSTVVTTGSVDTQTAGTYTVTYTSEDSSGNSTSLSRTVVVEEQPTVSSVAPLTNNRVLVTYSDESTRTITVFSNGSKKPRVELTADGERIVVFHQNGKTVRVFNALTGDRLGSKKIRSAEQAKAYLKLVQKGGQEYVVAVTKKKKTIRTTLMRLTSASKLKNTNTKKLRYTKTNFRVQIKNKKIRIKTRSGTVKRVYKITTTHKLKKV